MLAAEGAPGLAIIWGSSRWGLRASRSGVGEVAPDSMDGFHAAVSMFHSIPELLLHVLIFVPLSSMLFARRSSSYFRARRVGR